MKYYFKIIEGKSAEELENNLEEYMNTPADRAEFVSVNFNVVGGTWRALVTITKKNAAPPSTFNINGEKWQPLSIITKEK